MAKKDSKLQNFLKSTALISGSGGIVGLILALSGICLPCVLVPLGFIGSILLFLFSFISDYKWWFLGISVILLMLALSAKKVTICKDGVCKIDTKQKKKFILSFSNLKSNLAKLNNWKTYVAIPIILLFGALIFTISLSSSKSGDLKTTQKDFVESNSYTEVLDQAPFKGPADAKVTIIEYSDYFCPPCLPLYEDVIEPTLEKYDGQIKFVSVQVNVLMDLGYSSTHAAYCADEQDKYWEMHNMLIERIRPYVNKPKNMDLYIGMKALSEQGTPEYFADMAGEIGEINKEQYLECMNSDKYTDRIVSTTEYFQNLGFEGVPVIVINDRYFTGSLTEENLNKEIESILN